MKSLRAMSTDRSRFRTSLYDDTNPGEPPAVGDYPVKGNVQLPEHMRNSRPLAQAIQAAKSAVQANHHRTGPDHSHASQALGHHQDHQLHRHDIGSNLPPDIAMPNSIQYPQGEAHAERGRDRQSTADVTRGLSAVDLNRDDGSSQPRYRDISTHGPSTYGLAPYSEEVADRNLRSTNGNRYWHTKPLPIPKDEDIAPIPDGLQRPHQSSRQIETPDHTAGQPIGQAITSRSPDTRSHHPVSGQPSAPAAFTPTTTVKPARNRLRKNSIPRKRVGSGPVSPRETFPSDQKTPSHAVDGQKPEESQNAIGKPPVDGILDLSDSVDTRIITEQAPAVTHETVVPEVHHIREELITREIHEHEYRHRIQPIVDVQVLPTRHFVPVDGGLKEVPAEEIPGRQNHWQIMENTSGKLDATGSNAPIESEQRQLTSGDHPRTETLWKHPAKVEPYKVETGETWPLPTVVKHPGDYMGSGQGSNVRATEQGRIVPGNMASVLGHDDYSAPQTPLDPVEPLRIARPATGTYPPRIQTDMQNTVEDTPISPVSPITERFPERESSTRDSRQAPASQIQQLSPNGYSVATNTPAPAGRPNSHDRYSSISELSSNSLSHEPGNTRPRSRDYSRLNQPHKDYYPAVAGIQSSVAEENMEPMNPTNEPTTGSLLEPSDSSRARPMAPFETSRPSRGDLTKESILVSSQSPSTVSGLSSHSRGGESVDWRASNSASDPSASEANGADLHNPVVENSGSDGLIPVELSTVGGHSLTDTDGLIPVDHPERAQNRPFGPFERHPSDVVDPRRPRMRDFAKDYIRSIAGTSAADGKSSIPGAFPGAADEPSV